MALEVTTNGLGQYKVQPDNEVHYLDSVIFYPDTNSVIDQYATTINKMPGQSEPRTYSSGTSLFKSDGQHGENLLYVKINVPYACENGTYDLYKLIINGHKEDLQKKLNLQMLGSNVPKISKIFQLNKSIYIEFQDWPYDTLVSLNIKCGGNVYCGRSSDYTSLYNHSGIKIENVVHAVNVGNCKRHVIKINDPDEIQNMTFIFGMHVLALDAFTDKDMSKDVSWINVIDPEWSSIYIRGLSVNRSEYDEIVKTWDYSISSNVEWLSSNVYTTQYYTSFSGYKFSPNRLLNDGFIVLSTNQGDRVKQEHLQTPEPITVLSTSYTWSGMWLDSNSSSVKDTIYTDKKYKNLYEQNIRDLSAKYTIKDIDELILSGDTVLRPVYHPKKTGLFMYRADNRRESPVVSPNAIRVFPNFNGSILSSNFQHISSLNRELLISAYDCCGGVNGGKKNTFEQHVRDLSSCGFLMMEIGCHGCRLSDGESIVVGQKTSSSNLRIKDNDFERLIKQTKIPNILIISHSCYGYGTLVSGSRRYYGKKSKFNQFVANTTPTKSDQNIVCINCECATSPGWVMKYNSFLRVFFDKFFIGKTYIVGINEFNKFVTDAKMAFMRYMYDAYRGITNILEGRTIGSTKINAEYIFSDFYNNKCVDAWRREEILVNSSKDVFDTFLSFTLNLENYDKRVQNNSGVGGFLQLLAMVTNFDVFNKYANTKLQRPYWEVAASEFIRKMDEYIIDNKSFDEFYDFAVDDASANKVMFENECLGFINVDKMYGGMLIQFISYTIAEKRNVVRCIKDIFRILYSMKISMVDYCVENCIPYMNDNVTQRLSVQLCIRAMVNSWFTWDYPNAGFLKGGKGMADKKFFSY